MNALGALGDGDAIAAACAEINADPAVRCASLTGSGKCFSAGGAENAMREGTGNFSGGAVQIREGDRRNIPGAACAFFGLDMTLAAEANCRPGRPGGTVGCRAARP